MLEPVIETAWSFYYQLLFLFAYKFVQVVTYNF